MSELESRMTRADLIDEIECLLDTAEELNQLGEVEEARRLMHEARTIMTAMQGSK